MLPVEAHDAAINDSMISDEPAQMPSRSKPQRHDGSPPRFGFTVTKKTGNSVERNRIRRRLREAVRLHAAELAKTGMDYVLVGRRDALTLSFSDLVTDLKQALASSSRPRSNKPSPGASKPRDPAKG